MADLIEPCEICEECIKGVKCPKDKCPVALMKAENKRLKNKISDLRLEMSYMSPRNTIGDAHEMGAW